MRSQVLYRAAQGLGVMLVVQGEVDEVLERLPREHRQAVAQLISMASQGSLCAPSSPRFPPPPIINPVPFFENFVKSLHVIAFIKNSRTLLIVTLPCVLAWSLHFTANSCQSICPHGSIMRGNMQTWDVE